MVNSSERQQDRQAPVRPADPFYNLDRILHGDNYAQPATQPQIQRPQPDPYLALRPTMASEFAKPAVKKTDVDWGDLENDISTFAQAQKRYTNEQFQAPKMAAPAAAPQAYVQHSYEEDYSPPHVSQAKPRDTKSGFKTIGLIAGIAVIGITSVLGYRGLTGGSTDAPKVIKASVIPEKVAVVKPAVEPVKSVLERAPNNPTLVPRDEKPLSTSQQAAQTIDPDAPRKVRTVTISSDGNGNAVSRPTVASTSIPAALPNVTQTGSIDTSALPAKTVRTQTIANKPVEAVKPEPVKQASVMTPKTDTPKQAAAKPVSNAPLAIGPGAAAKPTQVATASGDYVVQVGSAKTETEAKSAFKSMQGKVSPLSNKSANYVKAEVNGNSLVRIRLSPTSKESADSLCSQIKSSGGNCFVTRS
jgi:SPOR domain